MTRHARAVFTLTVLAACSRPDVAPPADSRLPDSTAVATVSDHTLRAGYLMVSPERLAFRQCGDTARSGIVDSSGVLADAVSPFRTGPLDSLFFVLRGDSVVAQAEAGAESGSRLVVREVVRLSPESRGCTGMPDGYVFHAFGEEPFWALTIRADGMSFQEPDRQEPLRFPAAMAERSGGVVRYESVSLTPDSTSVIVELRHEMCSDSMSGEVTNHVAVVRLGSRELHGCAREGGTG